MDVALVGGGWIASHVLEGILEHGSRVVAVADPDERSRERWRARDVALFADHVTLLRASSAPVVAVLTPTEHHLPVTLDALAAGRHVIVEKPMAASPADGACMVAAAEAADRRLLVEESYLHLPTHRLARSLVAGGAIGPVRSVVMTFLGWRPLAASRDAVAAANAGWRSTVRFGWLTDHLPHLLAWARVLAGGAGVTDLVPLGGPGAGDVVGFTGHAGAVEVVWVRATDGDEGPLGRATGLHTRIVGTSGYVDVLGEGGSWGDGGPVAGVRLSSGEVLDPPDDEPDRLWDATVGYYPVAHRRCITEALRAVQGHDADVYEATDALDDLDAMVTLFDRIEQVRPGAQR